MTRFNPFLPQQPCYEGEGGGSGSGEGGTGTGGEGGAGGGKSGKDDAEYYKGEAKKAFGERDTFKKKLRDLEEKGLVVTEEQLAKYRELEKAAADAEEIRKRKEGEFDTLKHQLVEKHQKELADRDSKLTQLSTRFQSTLVRAEFGSAVDLFGGHDKTKTIFDVDMGVDVLGKYVQVEDTEDDPRGYRIVVKNPKGQVIVGKDGNPLPFAEAMLELIGSLPNKDRILRGSGKTGSGNSGGHGSGSGSRDLTKLKSTDFQDPEVREQIREKHDAAGGIQVGAAFRKKR